MLIVSVATGTLTTRLKKQEQLKAEAEKERMRGNLLRAVSHDLRTPLTSIYGSCSVMMENYDNKSNQFLATGKLAIGIKYTKDSMEIVEHLTKIGYVLFHTRKDEGQHLFAIEDAPVIKSVSELDTMIYKNISTAEIYVTLQLNPKELDSSSIHSSKKSKVPS